MLGTAGDESLSAIVAHVVNRDAAAALAQLDAALGEGVDVGQLLEQLLGYFRDCMAAAAGCATDAFLYASGTNSQQIAAAGKRLGLQTILAAMQILDQTLARLRYSTQGRILAELALVRLCCLEELDDLSELIAELRAGSLAEGAAAVSRPASHPAPQATAVKKNVEPTAAAEATPPAAQPAIPLSGQRATEIWSRALERISGIVVEQARRFDRVEIVPPNRLVVAFKPAYSVAKASCQRPEQVVRFEQALAEVTGQRVAVEFTLTEEAAEAAPAKRAVSAQQRLMEAVKNPMVRRAGELFGAEPLRVEEPAD